jgi:hypothetical protein
MGHLPDYFNLSPPKEVALTKELESFLFMDSLALLHRCGRGRSFSMVADTQCEFPCYQVMEQSQKI